MIKPEELRIGNWVKIKNIDFPLIIKRFERVLNGMYEVDPIPLTKEWARKLGFKKDFADWYEIGLFALNFKNKRCVVEVGDSYSELPFPKHVHTLQNLYFALTEKELTIKDK